MKIKKASWGNLTGSLEAKGAMLPVTLFRPTVKWKPIAGKGRRQFVSATIIRGRKKLIRGAFMANGKVMERRQAERNPIYPVSTIGVPYMIGSLNISNQVQERMADVASRQLAHNVARELEKGSKRL